MMKMIPASLVVLLVLVPFQLEAQKFYPDDPVKKDSTSWMLRERTGGDRAQ